VLGISRRSVAIWSRDVGYMSEHTDILFRLPWGSRGRSVQIRLDGELGPTTEILCGLPQGSPVSPILFMLYISPLFRLGNPKRRFGYADDGAFLVISLSLEDNYRSLLSSL
jgi:hypothetical protein